MSHPQTIDQEPPWTIAEVIDLEGFFVEDRGQDEKSLEIRDREIFLAYTREQIKTEPLSRRSKMRVWLEARRCSVDGSVPTAGEYFRQAFVSALSFLVVFGLLLGGMMAASHLLYFGDRPINVAVFFSLTVLPQVFLLLLVGAGLLFRARVRSFEGFTVLKWMVSILVFKIMDAKQEALERAGGERHARLRSVWGLVQAKRTIYGNLLMWPLLTMTQVFAVCFNLGLIAGMLMLVTISNRAFGWETTLHSGPDSVFHLTEIIAYPWSWLLPQAHPSLEQIKNSQIVLYGAGKYPLDALASWWPFLCYSILFYGFLPRCVLLLAATTAQRKSLAKLAFDHADCSRVLRRMEPTIIAGTPPPPLEIIPGNGSPARHAPSPVRNDDHWEVVVDRELVISEAEIKTFLRGRAVNAFRQMLAAVDEGQPSPELLVALSSHRGETESIKLAILLDASRPPIKAILGFLGGMRAAYTPQTEIRVLLVPSAESERNYSKEWEIFTNAMADPYLSVEGGT